MSVVFANPGSPIWADLRTNRAFLNARSGDEWDLFFAGVSGYRGMEDEATPLFRERPNHPLYFNPSYFESIASRIEQGQSTVEASSGTRWRYSGATDLVSFMCYAQSPDWASLNYLKLGTNAGLGLTASLGEVTEGLRGWRNNELDPRFAPGEARSASAGVPGSLADALKWSAAATGAGVLGNLATELLQKLLHS